jgi:hypothetical protein
LARSVNSDRQQRSTASMSASSPSMPRIVSCCPAKLVSAASSAVALDRTATGPPPRVAVGIEEGAGEVRIGADAAVAEPAVRPA